MIKRTIEISSGPCKLSVRNDQMVIERKDAEPASVPCEDIGVLMLDQAMTSLTQGLVNTLLEKEAAVVFCGKNHIPTGMLLPLTANLVQTERFRFQAEAKLPLKKQLWKQIIQTKIRHQAAMLGKEHADYSLLHALSYSVKSGDTSNIEAQAAKLYWKNLFPDSQFRRKPQTDAPNNFLDYGYAIIRAAVARALCASGLHPSLGLHHKNKYNPFCLADDLMEPFRPMIDTRVWEIWKMGKDEIDREVKTQLLQTLTDTVKVGDTTGPFMVALPRMTASLCRCFAGECNQLEIPVPWNFPDIE